MSSCNTIHKLFIFTAIFTSFILPFVISSPIPATQYEKFINFLVQNNCAMPKDLKLPFPDSSNPSPFSYLSIPLKECNTSVVSNYYDEANLLCTETFEVIKNITCQSYNGSLSMIESDHLSVTVCEDFQSLKDILPRNDNYMSRRLSDDLICKVWCSAEKHEYLCRTLLWGYNVLAKMESALPSEVQENVNESIDKGSSDEAIMPVKNISNDNKLEVNNENTNKPTKLTNDADIILPKEKNSVGSNIANLEEEKSFESNIAYPEEKKPTLNQTDPESHISKISTKQEEVTSQYATIKKDSSDPKNQSDVFKKTDEVIKNDVTTNVQSKSETQNQKLSNEISEDTVKQPESRNLPSLNLEIKPIKDTENKVETSSKKQINDNIPQTKLDTNDLNPSKNGISDNQDKKNKSVDASKVIGNDKDAIHNNVGEKTNIKSEESISPAAENDNELKGSNFPEEDKSKTKESEMKIQDEKEIEKPKQTDYEGANEILPDNDSKLTETATQSVLPEDDEHQEEKDQDQYNDIENEGDYAKPEYENSFNQPSKNKESQIKSSIAAGSNQIPNSYDISSRNTIGRIPEENIAMIAPFPEQEDSHFFFYFLSIVLIIMAGYLIFHNKQKIIALIVEGRHERRRRSHGAGYKKLETK